MVMLFAFLCHRLRRFLCRCSRRGWCCGSCFYFRCGLCWCRRWLLSSRAFALIGSKHHLRCHDSTASVANPNFFMEKPPNRMVKHSCAYVHSDSVLLARALSRTRWTQCYTFTNILVCCQLAFIIAGSLRVSSSSISRSIAARSSSISNPTESGVCWSIRVSTSRNACAASSYRPSAARACAL